MPRPWGENAGSRRKEREEVREVHRDKIMGGCIIKCKRIDIYSRHIEKPLQRFMLRSDKTEYWMVWHSIIERQSTVRGLKGTDYYI